MPIALFKIIWYSKNIKWISRRTTKNNKRKEVVKWQH